MCFFENEGVESMWKFALVRCTTTHGPPGSSPQGRARARLRLPRQCFPGSSLKDTEAGCDVYIACCGDALSLSALAPASVTYLLGHCHRPDCGLSCQTRCQQVRRAGAPCARCQWRAARTDRLLSLSLVACTKRLPGARGVQSLAFQGTRGAPVGVSSRDSPTCMIGIGQGTNHWVMLPRHGWRARYLPRVGSRKASLACP